MGQDITPPTISSVTSTTANGSYKKDSIINITLNFVDENNLPEKVKLIDWVHGQNNFYRALWTNDLHCRNLHR